jgi:hypothetical protein
MGDSIVDLGAGAADYVGEKLSDIYDYMMGAPEASASGGYYKKLSPGARQYFSGPDDDDRKSLMDYIGFDDGGAVPNGSAVNLGAGGFTDFSSMSMDEALYGTSDPVEISRRTRPSYSETGEAYYFVDDQARPFIDEEGYRVDLGSDARSRGMAGEYFEQEMGRVSPYEGMAEPLTGQSTPDFSSRPTDLRGYKGAPELYMQEGGNPAIEEAGIFSALFNAPNADAQNLVRESGREGSAGAQTYYPEGALTFEQRLEQEYGYPSVPREMSDAPEDVRNQRPRHDMPTFQELEDARAHALMSAEMAKEFGPETATKLGNFAEGIDALPIPLIGNATPEDVAMDKRNNAFGVKLLREAGVNATLPEIARMVDDKVFEQLDQILGREPGSRSFRSPSTGIDVYFPRNEQGFFQTSRSGYY